MPGTLRRLRILVYEHASGGGLVGRRVPAPLGREGRAMRDALIADLAALGHDVVASVDPRFPAHRPAQGARLVPPAPLGRLLRGADAVWLIAPETDRCLERLAARVERRGVRLLGPSAAAIRVAADKARLPAVLRRARVPHPPTRRVRRGLDAGLLRPAVVKPARGAGSVGVARLRKASDLRPGRILQDLVPGIPASVALVCNGRDARPLAVSRQLLGPTFGYRGGVTPFAHPLAARAAAHARAACRAIPGLRGYVGVDVVLGRDAAWVIEINPRLTTSYLGLRAAAGRSVAALALAACAGKLPGRPLPFRRPVRFRADGRTRTRRP